MAVRSPPSPPVSGTGGYTIPAPASGVAFTIQGTTGANSQVAILNTNAPGNDCRVDFDLQGVAKGLIGAAGGTNSLVTGSATGDIVVRPLATNFIVTTNGTTLHLKINASGNAVFSGNVGVNGVASAPAQVTGFGTPTGTGVINNFAGASATLAQCSQAIAQLITDLKNFGLYGA